VTKGALVALDISSFSPLTTIFFQYNPDTLTRTLQAQDAGGEGTIFESQRLKGAPVETIRLEAEFDATGQNESTKDKVLEMGIHAQLAALEMLIYPKTALVTDNTIKMAMGMIEVVPPTGPLVAFVWNRPRVLPVRLTEFTITEQAFDHQLNPIRASVSLSLRVLSYNDFSWIHPGFTAFMVHQVIKESLAAVGTGENLKNLGSGSTK
jgi:hypothetical protein